MSICISTVLLVASFVCSQPAGGTYNEVTRLNGNPDQGYVHRLYYGADSLQFGDLRIPQGDGPFPIVMIIHGGCWLSQYDLTLMDSMAHDLTSRGYATWNIEYRRTGDAGGGWPGTFTDVANALKYLKTLANDYPLKLENIVVSGHSAGGHLALMLGAQAKLETASPLKVGALPPIRGIVSLAGIVDLSTYLSDSGCGSNTANLAGGSPEDVPDHYTQGSPISHLPIGIPHKHVVGVNDSIVPISHINPFIERARSAGDDVELISVPEVGHFEVITPGSDAWPGVVRSIRAFSGSG